MILASIDWLSISITLLLVVFVVVCLLMTLLILMQRPKQEGLGAAFGGGVTDQVFGARTTNVLQRGTVYLGSLFFILSLTLAILVGQKNKQKSLLPKQSSPAQTATSDTTAPALPTSSEGPQSLAEELPVEVNLPGGSPATAPSSSDAPAEPETKPEVTPQAPSEPATPEPPSGAATPAPANPGNL